MSKQISTSLTDEEFKRVDYIVNAGYALNRSDYLRNLIRTDIKKRSQNKNGGM